VANMSLKVVPALWVYQGNVGSCAARVRWPCWTYQRMVRL
jgi:hypothetical protein